MTTTAHIRGTIDILENGLVPIQPRGFRRAARAVFSACKGLTAVASWLSRTGNRPFENPILSSADSGVREIADVHSLFRSADPLFSAPPRDR